MYPKYYEELELHKKIRSRGYLLTEPDIIDFARKFDPQPFHIDPEYARTTRFGGLFCSGVHLISISQRLMDEMSAQTAWIAGMGWDEVRFLTAGRPGDVLELETELTAKRESKSDPSRGVVHLTLKLLNQRNEVVLSYKAFGLIEKRPSS